MSNWVFKTNSYWVGILASLLCSCATNVTEESVAGADGEIVSTANRWQIPESVMNISNPYQIQYDNVPAPNSPSLCPGQLRPGASALKEYLESTSVSPLTISGYQCEVSSQTNRYDMHATGRALDIYFDIAEGPTRDDFGDAIANWMVVNAQEIGVQVVIWNRTVWNASRPTSPINTRERPYIVLDHGREYVHIELNESAANMDTPFFDSNWVEPTPPDPDSSPTQPGTGQNPPTQSQEEIYASLMPEGCVALPLQGGTIDNGNPCMQLDGNPANWSFSDYKGFEDSDYAWTHVTSNPQSSNAGYWYVRLEQPETMAAEVFVPKPELSHPNTQYILDTPYGSTTIVADLTQQSEAGWISLGELNLGQSNILKVSNVVENITDSAITVPVDALRIYPLGQRPEDPVSKSETQNFTGGGCNTLNSTSSFWSFWGMPAMLLLFGLKKRRSKIMLRE